jgi:hypothetical protein
MGCNAIYWMVLAHDRDQMRVLMNAVMHLRVAEREGKLLTDLALEEPVGLVSYSYL